MGNNDRMGTVAQIMLCVLFLSVAALLLSALGDPGDVISSAVINALSEVGPLHAWIDLLYSAKGLFPPDASLVSAAYGSLSLALEGIVRVVISTALDSMVIGLCIHLANLIARRGQIVFRGGMLLPTLIGAVTGCVLCGATGLLSSNNVRSALSVILRIVVICIGIWIMVTGKLPSPDIGVVRRYLLPIILGALTNAVLAMYVSVLALVLGHVLVPALPWVTGIGIVTVGLMILFHGLEALVLRGIPHRRN